MNETDREEDREVRILRYNRKVLDHKAEAIIINILTSISFPSHSVRPSLHTRRERYERMKVAST